MVTAAVTGATAGIGHAFVQRLAARGHDLVLVARDATRLEATAVQLQERFGITTEVVVADLGNREELERVAERLRDPGRPVDVLVNNAGFVLNRDFLSSDSDDEERLLDVMVRAVLVLTKAAVPGMVSRGRGRVITVSSIAGFLPTGTYSAVKAWATTFSASLAGELAGTGVTATALCPGYTRTELHRRAELELSMVPNWAWLDVDRLVAQAWADAEHGAVVSVPSRRYKAVALVMRHLPLRTAKIMSRSRVGRRAVTGGRGRTPGEDSGRRT